MITKQIPFSSLSAGALSDGALLGQINESQFHAVLANSLLATNRYVLRMDLDVGQFTSLGATLDASTSVAPFGATAAMTTGDGLLLACDDDVDAVIANIATAGVGTWTALEVWDSTDGLTFNRDLTAGITDGTSAFKSTGWREIHLPHTIDSVDTISTRRALKPSPLLSGEAGTSRKWVLVKPSGTYTVTTAPIVSSIVLRHSDVTEKWIDLTASVNGSLTASPGTTTQFFPYVGSIVAYFSDDLPTGWERYVWTAQGNARTRVIKYATNAAGTQFATAQNAADPSNDFTAVPTASPQRYSVRWDAPSNAVKVTRSFALANGGTLAVAGKYMWIIETTAVSTPAPQDPTNSRVRVKMLGASGVEGDAVSPFTARRVSLRRRGGSAGSGAVSFALYNATQQLSRVVSFPDTDAGHEQNYDIVDLAFADGDRLLLYHQAGTRQLTDVEFTIYG